MSYDQIAAKYWAKQYRELKTGLTFASVSRDLAIEQRNKRENFEYMFITRHTVLGRWHQYKQEMFEIRFMGYENISKKEMIDFLENKQKPLDKEKAVDDGTSYIF